MTSDATNRLDALGPDDRDALLAAYALGELEGTERDFIERLLADPAAGAQRAMVAETRALARALRAARAEDDAPPRSADLRRAVVTALAATRTTTPAAAARGPFGTLSGWLALAGAVAATALVAVTVLAPLRGARDIARRPAGAAPEKKVAPAEPAAQPSSIVEDLIETEHARMAAEEPPVAAAAPAEVLQEPAAMVPAADARMNDSVRIEGPVARSRGAYGGHAAPSARALPPPGPRGRGQGEVAGTFAHADRDVSRRLAEDRRPDRERYGRFEENRFLSVADQPLSTFSIDVDTASYAVARRFLAAGRLPPADAVRIEEFVNYFAYSYPQPAGDDPFAVALEAADCPWRAGHRLVRIGIAGRAVDRAQRPAGNLVFLIDVSGSMDEPDKLPLVKQALAMLVAELTENDRVSIVTYAGDAGVKLPPTSGDQKRKILDVIEGLSAGGATHGSAGIVLAYDQAREKFVAGGANRVILCTDGDLNVGITSDAALVELVQEKARGGTFLTVLGFGRGNLQDEKLETLADKGNGVYAYIDGVREARKVLVEQLTGSTITIAKDVKIQVEFNPAQVASYRLLGYENRRLADADFRDDTKDAGEIGAGHTVTALYEIVPAGGTGTSGPGAGAEPLKYQVERPRATEPAPAAGPASRELLTVKLRFKQPEGDTSVLREFPLADAGGPFAAASADTRFAAAVAAFGMILRQSEFTGDATLPLVAKLAADALGSDEAGHRAEFLDLVRKADMIKAGDRR